MANTHTHTHTHTQDSQQTALNIWKAMCLICSTLKDRKSFCRRNSKVLMPSSSNTMQTWPPCSNQSSILTQALTGHSHGSINTTGSIHTTIKNQLTICCRRPDCWSPAALRSQTSLLHWNCRCSSQSSRPHVRLCGTKDKRRSALIQHKWILLFTWWSNCSWIQNKKVLTYLSLSIHSTTLPKAPSPRVEITSSEDTQTFIQCLKSVKVRRCVTNRSVKKKMNLHPDLTITTFMSVKPSDRVNKTPGQFPADDVFPKLTEQCLCLNPTRALAQRCHNVKLKTEHKALSPGR